MRCERMIEVSGEAAGSKQLVRCGRCLACNIRRQSSWVLRMILEQQCSAHAFFLTLTYADRYVPEKLDYDDISKFVKRYRSSTDSTVRFFCVGEYGTKTGRPHWHLIVFSQDLERCPCRGSFNMIQWPLGGVFVGDASPASMGYVARYALKSGLRSNVVGMSRRPGLGLGRLAQLGADLAAQQDWMQRFPSYMMVGKRYYPLDRNGYRVFRESYEKHGGEVLEKRNVVGADLRAAITAILEPLPDQNRFAIKVASRLIRELEQSKV